MLRGLAEGLLATMMSSNLKRCVINNLGSIFLLCTVLEQQRRRHGVDKPRGDGNIVRPKSFQVQVDFDPVHTDVRDRAAGRHDVLADYERRRYADGLYRRIHTAAIPSSL